MSSDDPGRRRRAARRDRWDVANLRREAVGISASRRTDIPAHFASWFEARLRAGFVEYVPGGPPRRIRRGLGVEEVTHFNFWTKWPRPFLRVLGRVVDAGYPVLWNVTVTGLGGTELEPRVPAPDRVVRSIRELAHVVPPAAILWRYDPILLSRRFDAPFHLRTFRRLAEELCGSVDRVAVSFVTQYRTRVRPDLIAYREETGDPIRDAPVSEQVDVVAALREIAGEYGLPLTVCCAPRLRRLAGCPRAECNAWSWATRVHPDLRAFRWLRDRPCREDCGCSEEVDIGCYDTCVFGCRYSYGSASLEKARRNFARHDPRDPCLIPAGDGGCGARSESDGRAPASARAEARGVDLSRPGAS